MNNSSSNRFNPSQSNMKKTGISGKNINEDMYMGSNMGKT
jgi:hypothetical protein